MSDQPRRAKRAAPDRRPCSSPAPHPVAVITPSTSGDEIVIAARTPQIAGPLGAVGCTSRVAAVGLAAECTDTRNARRLNEGWMDGSSTRLPLIATRFDDAVAFGRCQGVRARTLAIWRRRDTEEA